MNNSASPFELITFDVYMALMDIGGSLVPRIAEVFSIPEERASRFVALWRRKQMERAASSTAMALGHQSFARCTAMALDYTLGHFELKCDQDQAEQLVDLWGQLDPWPEADAVVSQLNAAGFATAILSNGDQAMLDATATRFTARFDHVFSAESAGKYKPHPDVYALPEKLLGVAPSRVLHVAGSPNDVLGAIAFGLPCVWSNRKGEALVDARYPPQQQFPDLNGLLDYLCK